jgi:hypothetical protein
VTLFSTHRRAADPLQAIWAGHAVRGIRAAAAQELALCQNVLLTRRQQGVKIDCFAQAGFALYRGESAKGDAGLQLLDIDRGDKWKQQQWGEQHVGGEEGGR